MLSLHSCPLDMPGTRDSGGMNVYVHQVALCLGKLGIGVDIFTRHHRSSQGVYENNATESDSQFPGSVSLHSRNRTAKNGKMIESYSCLTETISLDKNVRIIHLPVEDDVGKLELYRHLPDIASAIYRFGKQEAIDYHLVHSHYWLSGRVGEVLSNSWRVPHIVMLHTSARGKNYYLGAPVEPELRGQVEQEVLSSASKIIASTTSEKHDLITLYGADADKISVIPCGVDLDLFRPYPRMLASILKTSPKRPSSITFLTVR